MRAFACYPAVPRPACVSGPAAQQGATATTRFDDWVPQGVIPGVIPAVLAAE